MIFQRLLSARNCPVPLIILAIKIGLLCNFAKKIKGCPFMGQSSTVLKFLVAIEF